MRIRTLAPAVLGLILATGATAQGTPPIDYDTFTLDNGLQFIVHEDHSVPIVHVVKRELASQPVQVVLKSM